MLLEVRDSSYLGLLSIFGPRKEGFLLRACLAKKNWIFGKISSSPRPRGPPRRGHVRLGERVHLSVGMYA